MTEDQFTEEEAVDGIPVLEDEHVPATTSRDAPTAPAAPGGLSPVTLPAVQAVAAAATGFVAGAATLALVRRHGARKAARAGIRRRSGSDGLPILGTRSFLVDVHLIGKPGE